MSIIHSSSIAYYPVAYNKPQPGRNGNETPQINAVDSNTERQSGKLNAQPSSTEQIKAALSKAGLSRLSNGNVGNQPNNIRIQKGLNAYTQNHNQAAQLRVAETISGIDLYA